MSHDDELNEDEVTDEAMSVADLEVIKGYGEMSIEDFMYSLGLNFASEAKDILRGLMDAGFVTSHWKRSCEWFTLTPQGVEELKKHGIS